MVSNVAQWLSVLRALVWPDSGQPPSHRKWDGGTIRVDHPTRASAAAQCVRPEHRDGEYQRGRHGSEICGVEDEPDARPQVAAEGS